MCKCGKCDCDLVTPDDYRRNILEETKMSDSAIEVINKMNAMGLLGLPQTYLWEGDSSPRDYALLESLVEYLGTGIGWVARIDNSQIEYVTEENIGEGSFIVCMS